MADDNNSGNGAGTALTVIAALEQARIRLQPFLDAHPYSTVDEFDSGNGWVICIRKPWGDESLVIFIPNDLDVFADALNNIYLPERFTAIWHKDKKELEIIWTAFPLFAPYDEVAGRQFKFHFDSKEYDCEFSRSSDRLLLIAEYSAPVAMSTTGHRNLSSYNAYTQRQEHETEVGSRVPPTGEPVSFWVRNVEWDDDKVMHLVRHLNFYMTYYDDKAPKILIHNLAEEAAIPRTRYLVGKFPKRIDAREVEVDLLHLWGATRDGDAARRFVYCYRIVEYASHTYLDRDVRMQVGKLLSAPHALSDISDLTDRIVSATLASKADDSSRIGMLLKDAVDPNLIWAEVDQNRSSFEEETIFDGGFTLAPTITPGANQSGFSVTGISSFANSIRAIRNHLSHGRDKATRTSITPTAANFAKLEPWVSALSVAAGEVINFKHIR